MPSDMQLRFMHAATIVRDQIFVMGGSSNMGKDGKSPNSLDRVLILQLPVAGKYAEWINGCNLPEPMTYLGGADFDCALVDLVTADCCASMSGR